MKTLFKFLFFLLISLNSNCQTVTTIIPYETPSYETPNGAYLKDLDNEFSFWLGTWEGIDDDKKYEFTFVLFQQHLTTYPNGEYEFSDEVVGKLKVTNISTNEVIYDESSFTNFDEYLIHGYLIKGRSFYCGLTDKEYHCNNGADFTLVRSATDVNEILYKDFRYDEYYTLDGPCPYATQEDIPIYLPKVDLVLTRQ